MKKEEELKERVKTFKEKIEFEKKCFEQLEKENKEEEKYNWLRGSHLATVIQYLDEAIYHAEKLIK